MTLKHLRFIAVALALAVTTSGCSYLFGPKPDAAKPFVKKSDDDCVKNVPSNVKAWLKDGKSDIGQSVDCAVGAIDDFSRHVSGKTKNVYTEVELNEFISEFLITADSPNAGNVNAMTEQIVNVKQIVLGGTSGVITADELTRLKSLLIHVRPLLVALSPNIQTLLFSSPSASAADVTNVSASLVQIADLLAQEFDRSNSSRPAIGFKELLASAHTLGLKNDSVADWIPLVESLKVLVLSGDSDVLRASEWAPMIRTIAQGWGLALRAKYNLLNNPDVLGRDFPLMEQTTRQLIGLLDRSVQAHGGSIPNKVFEKIIDALAAKDMMPALNGRSIGAQTLKALLPATFGKMLYGRWHTDYDRQGQAFGVAQLSRVRELADDWIAGQILINGALNGNQVTGVSQFGQTLAHVAVTRKSFADDTTYTMAQRAQKQLLLFLSRGRPPIHDSAGRLVVAPRQELISIQKSDLDSMNEDRVLMEAVLTGWTHNSSNAIGIVGTTEPETQEIYLDLRDLGHDLNFIDIRSNQAGVRTFMENAIFMSSSDGNAYMGLQESVEWLNFVTSGSKVADQMWLAMQRTCGTSKIDVLGHQKLEAQCFRREFLSRWTQYLPNLPHLIRWASLEDGSGARAAAMLTALENAGRNRGASNELVESSEFRAMIPIAHYLESMFARHDVNGNGVIDNDELWNAFPLLAPFIKKMGNGKADDDAMQRTIFSYILQFGEVPSTDPIGMVKIGGWYLVHGLFQESADRAKILGVIGAFPAAAKATRLQSIQQYYNDNDDSLRALIVRREPTNAAKLADLFQCLPGATPILAADMAAQADRLTPDGDEIGADSFTTQMKALIGSDSRLEIYCLPF